MSEARVGIDLGGTKIEGVLMSATGDIVRRQRVATPRSYEGVLAALTALVGELRGGGAVAGIGVSAPGTATRDGLVKNSNSVWLNGMPFYADLQKSLGQEVQFANDADCLALSEAVDGAAAGAASVFAVIIGTGVGGGIASGAEVVPGRNALRGEWGHVPLPWMVPSEYPGPDCYCGLNGCLETFVSGTGLENDYARVTGVKKTGVEIAAASAAGDSEAVAAIERYTSRLARGLAMVVNILDPDVVVLGGGMSNLGVLYEKLPALVQPFVLGGEFDTPIVKSMHGDSSGVRGAAWLSAGRHASSVIKR